MPASSFSKSFALAALALCLSAALCAQGSPRRVALVVGNGAYSANPLLNPPNDARDVAEGLRSCGFEVSLALDAGQASFEKAVEDFGAALRGAEVGLFYYAGHGVQADGINYLIPVSPRIDSAASLKVSAIAVDRVVGEMESTGVRTALVFLDCCRDNPFPGASRSGGRGLAVVATPRTVNSLIAYATSPGETAQDGSGRNGVFSGAFIEELRDSGQEISELMRNVKKTVAERTGGRQQPRFDVGMTEPFYFVSPEAAAAKAEAELGRTQAELAALDASIAARSAAIAAAKSEKERGGLEVEQQKSLALQAAKRIEAANAKAESERRAADAAKARVADEERRSLDAAGSAMVASLKAQAAARRAEYESLARVDDSLEAFVKEIFGIQSALAEIGARYQAAAAQGEADIGKYYDAKLGELGAAKAEDWESEADFSKRVADERLALGSRRASDLADRRSALASEQASSESQLRAKLEGARSRLFAATYTVKGQAAKLGLGAFDKERKLWPAALGSVDPNLPYSISTAIDISGSSDMKSAYTAMDAAIRAGALAGEIDYGVSPLRRGEGLVLVVKESRIVDLGSGKVVARVGPPASPVAVIGPPARKGATFSVYRGCVTIDSPRPGAQVRTKDRAWGPAPATVYLSGPGEEEIVLSWKKASASLRLSVAEGRLVLANIDKAKSIALPADGLVTPARFYGEEGYERSGSLEIGAGISIPDSAAFRDWLGARRASAAAALSAQRGRDLKLGFDKASGPMLSGTAVGVGLYLGGYLDMLTSDTSSPSYVADGFKALDDGFMLSGAVLAGGSLVCGLIYGLAYASPERAPLGAKVAFYDEALAKIK